MSEMFVMRRANGDLLSEETDGRLRIPVWSSETAPARYKERNPELLTFFPARLTPPLMNKIKLGAAEAPEFFLLPADDPDANLEVGELISPDEFFSMAERNAQLAELQA